MGYRRGRSSPALAALPEVKAVIVPGALEELAVVSVVLALREPNDERRACPHGTVWSVGPGFLSHRALAITRMKWNKVAEGEPTIGG
jgi:hypothetical protein